MDESSQTLLCYLQKAEASWQLRPALLRQIHFCLPRASMRRELLFSLHRVNPDRVSADYAVLAGLSRGLSGGDILNVCINAIDAGSADSDSAKWLVTHAILEREIAKVKKAKAKQGGFEAVRNRYLRLENPPFMRLVFEVIGGPFPNGAYEVSVAHYSEQNGDAMRDPEITFLVLPTSDGPVWCPLTFENNYLGAYQVVAVVTGERKDDRKR